MFDSSSLIGLFSGIGIFSLGGFLSFLGIYILGMCISFLPFLISKERTATILFLNLILLPTILGWICLLIYAIINRKDSGDSGSYNNNYGYGSRGGRSGYGSYGNRGGGYSGSGSTYF